jgi:hypothetical protein
MFSVVADALVTGIEVRVGVELLQADKARITVRIRILFIFDSFLL